ncbi:MAG: hypothetical protein IPJ84_06930 [Bdellovibrionales bacterium]|nr:hypothetical protein [Bdellovibrionales bacterium]
MKWVVILFIAFVSFQAQATGRTVGNGGDVVVCENQAGVIESIELLDFYEGRILKGIKTDFGSQARTVDEKVATALARLERVSPARAQLYRERALQFFADTLFLEDGHLADIRDAGDIVIPNGCRIAQIANQSAPLYPDDKRYVIDRSLWTALDDDSRAGLILHEIIYREAIELGHENSVSTRLLNSGLCSQKIETMTVSQYTRFLTELGFTTNEVLGVLLKLNPVPDFFPDGTLKSGSVVDGSTYRWAGQDLRLRDQVLFFSSGQIRELTLQGVQTVSLMGAIRVLSPYELTFFESGALESASFEESTHFTSAHYELEIDGAAHFFENGGLRLAQVRSGWVQFAGRQVGVSGVLQLYADGALHQGVLTDPVAVKVQTDEILLEGLTKLGQQGQLLEASLAQEASLAIGARRAEFSRWSRHPESEKSVKLTQGCLASDAVLPDASGKLKTYAPRTVLKFNEDGRVVEQLGRSCEGERKRSSQRK